MVLSPLSSVGADPDKALGALVLGERRGREQSQTLRQLSVVGELSPQCRRDEADRKREVSQVERRRRLPVEARTQRAAHGLHPRALVGVFENIELGISKQREQRLAPR